MTSGTITTALHHNWQRSSSFHQHAQLAVHVRTYGCKNWLHGPKLPSISFAPKTEHTYMYKIVRSYVQRIASMYALSVHHRIYYSMFNVWIVLRFVLRTLCRACRRSNRFIFWLTWFFGRWPAMWPLYVQEAHEDKLNRHLTPLNGSCKINGRTGRVLSSPKKNINSSSRRVQKFFLRFATDSVRKYSLQI
jgi:hypothetical protein